jgi:hypothetical protein
VTSAVFGRLKKVGHDEYGVVFEPPDAPVGTAIGRTPLGECVLVFVHNPAHAFMVLKIVKMPPLLSAEVLWRGLRETIERCKGET